MKAINDLEISTHFWGRTIFGNVGIFIKEEHGIFIAGNWEGSYEIEELELIEIIEKPKNI